MSAPTPTAAEQALADLFEARAATRSNGRLDSARAGAFSRFAAGGLPHRRVEEYKYTDLKARLRTLPAPATDADAAKVSETLAAHPPLVDGTPRVVVANGRFMPELSTFSEGITAHSILAFDAPTEGVGALVAESTDPLTLANVGLFDGGVVLHVSGDAGAIELVHVATEDALVMGRFAIMVPDGASVSVTERFIGAPSALNNTLGEIWLGERARADLVRITHGDNAGTTQLSTHHIKIAANAHLEHLTVTTGHGLSRNQIFCHVAGDDAEANFHTAVVAIGQRHSDNTLLVRHNALHSRSSEIFRSAVGDGGKSIVQGRINVDPGAQKTDARMMSNALFLDDTGEVVNKPELEIFADDVQCGHGATSGDLDDEPVFYLRARGVPEAVARRMLVEAFLLEALENVEDEQLREALQALVTADLSRTENA
ncbi:MAG: Fe-S cluster assembly protein SufD [Pseudomonadota bacterium]